jgi:hypothetical protein
MGTRNDALKTRLQHWIGRVLLALVVVVCSPLLLPLLVIYGLYALLLHVLLWLLWSPAGKRVLFVYSNSPVWQSYIENNILPEVAPGLCDLELVGAAPLAVVVLVGSGLLLLRWQP